MQKLTRRPLGDTKLELTALGIGAAGLAGLYQSVSFSTAFEALQAAWDNGVRYFDTAPFYGYGKSENRVGHALRNFLQFARRDEFVLSTKVGRILKSRSRSGAQVRNLADGWSNPFPFEPVFDYTYSGVMRSYEDSLQRLGLDRIDILLIHDIGSATHGDQAGRYWQQLTTGGGFNALDELRSSHAIQAVGLGVNESEVVLNAMQEFDLDCCLLAGRYTLLEQQSLDRLFPECVRRNVSILLGGVFNSGILAKGRTYNYGAVPSAIMGRVAQLEAICHDYQVPLTAAALQFPYAHPQVSTVISGSRSAEELRENIQHFSQIIPREFWSDLVVQGLLHPAAPVPGDAK